ncbi:hypothetical protein GCM10009017_26530 [Halarchaeum rubridurum]|uniref:Uncharacterized protein n=1 Tax=Halarchaeum rubridurum TaxID=489911 RepID=A0A830G4R6_9EURY|nr:hypothetical protein GCM10009017_26530 [Halarchaeum rubridurum]
MRSSTHTSIVSVIDSLRELESSNATADSDCASLMDLFATTRLVGAPASLSGANKPDPRADPSLGGG